MPCVLSSLMVELDAGPVALHMKHVHRLYMPT